MAEKKKFYLTTAIAYTSGKPHIGNTYEAVLADSIVRFKRQQGYDVRFQTGTDAPPTPGRPYRPPIPRRPRRRPWW